VIAIKNDPAFICEDFIDELFGNMPEATFDFNSIPDESVTQQI
jgi:hypothetical protein